MQTRKGNYRHGHKTVERTTAEYEAWRSMIQRCYNPHVKNYPRYGGRGIKVCQRWRDSFIDFLHDIGYKPGEGRQWSIDRINNDGDYEPGNCRWATRKEQARNVSDNRPIEYANRTQCLAAWAEEYGMSAATLANRLKLGWSIARALTEPVTHGKERQRNKLGNRMLTYDGRTQCVAAWAEEQAIPDHVLRARLKSGWTTERALTTPEGRK